MLRILKRSTPQTHSKKKQEALLGLSLKLAPALLLALLTKVRGRGILRTSPDQNPRNSGAKQGGSARTASLCHNVCPSPVRWVASIPLRHHFFFFPRTGTRFVRRKTDEYSEKVANSLHHQLQRPKIEFPLIHQRNKLSFVNNPG
jgi:hypothetical protein